MLLLIYFRLFYHTTDHCTIYTSTSAPTFPIPTLTVHLLLLLSVHLPLHVFFLSQHLQHAYFYSFPFIYFCTYSFYPSIFGVFKPTNKNKTFDTFFRYEKYKNVKASLSGLYIVNIHLLPFITGK